MEQQTFNLTSPVWLFAWSTIKNLYTPDSNILQHASIYPFNPKSPPERYTLIGDAHITIKLHSAKVITKNKIAVLQAEKQKVMADSEAKYTRIEKELQSLLAIEML